MTSRGLALRLGVGEPRTEAMLARFKAMFPALQRGLDRAVEAGQLRGHAETGTGLRRHRPRASAPLSRWERNWMANHPVQGTACALFKVAGNRLDRLYRRYDARLLLALHDAYVYEAPLEKLGEVGALTRRVMIDAVAERYPMLRPEAVINDRSPWCWNKDGHADSLDRWAEDPTYAL